MNSRFTIFLTLAILFVVSQGRTASEDLVEEFPGYGEYNFDIYSGMLNVTKTGSRQIHYIYQESQNDPKSDPLLLWFNGGPGASSLIGLVMENGPFIFKGINTFMSKNEYAWNLKANVLYLEGPPGVGFSPNNDPDYKYDDDNTAEDFLNALLQFRNRFQNITNFENPIFLSGESYAGMYIPFLSRNIINYNEQASTKDKFNFKGFLIGNGIFIMNVDMMNAYEADSYVVNNFFTNKLKGYFYNDCPKDLNSTNCKEFQKTYKNVVNNTDILQIYNYTYTYSSPRESNGENKIQPKFQTKFEQYIQNLNAQVLNPDAIVKAYFNMDEVKAALHVDPSITWSGSNDEIFEKYDLKGNSTVLYNQFFDAGIKVLIFSGNIDGDVPTKYTQFCLDDMMTNPVYGNNFTEEGKWRQWKPLSDRQVGGLVQYYKTQTGSEFVYAMVRSAGHLVPMFQPEASFHMLESFMNDQPI